MRVDHDDQGCVPTNLVTSTRLMSANDTVAAIQSFFPEYDIQGFAEHTPAGISIVRSVEVLRGNPRSGYLNLGKGFGIEAALASGYMEAIELSTIEHAPQLPCFSPVDIDPESLIYVARKKNL